MGTLYLVATPIGNLEDITARALRILGDVQLIAAEDTRHTGRLLAHFGIRTPLISYHDHNRSSRAHSLLQTLDRGDLALVSDAGSPGLSDPGHELVVAAIEAGHPVSPVPGPSSLVAAVTASGLVPGPFLYLGFLPRRGGKRSTILGRSVMAGVPLVIFEAGNRLQDTMNELLVMLGDRPAAIARELTKLHEEVLRGRLSRLMEDVAKAPIRGEAVLVIGAATTAAVGTEEVETVVASLLRAGLGPSQAAREAATMTGIGRSHLYQVARRLKQNEC